MKVLECVEAWKVNGDDFEFDHFSITLANGMEIFRGRSARKYTLDQEIDTSDLDCHLVPLPPEDLWPPLTDDLTRAPDPLPNDVFLKRPSFCHYYPRTNMWKPREVLLHEAHVCEILRKHPHRNIASYLGCVGNGGFITGLCFVKYEETLYDRLRDSSRPLDTHSCLLAVREAIAHLRSLGLNHNDISPLNIMLDQQDVPVVIDFNSCQWEGEHLYDIGTPGWTYDAQRTTSARRNDDFGLEKLSQYLASLRKP